MKAVILAAGRGKRMMPLTLTKPKPLLVVMGKTFLDHIFDSFPSTVKEVIVVIGYKGEQIKMFLGDKYKGKKIHYVIQNKLNGTGPAVQLTKPYFKKKERFLIVLGDEPVTKKEIKKCLSHEFSWLSRRADIPEQSAVATLAEGNRVIEVIEKPKHPASNFVVAGAMVVNADIFDYQPTKHRTGEYYLTSMMNKFVKNNKVIAVAGVDNLYFVPGKFDKPSYKG
jgi:NDP-sugar pyrophosphorylase family protein